MSALADWTDPVYVAAKKARTEAYAEFCRVAGANPFIYGQTGFNEYYEANTVPAREKFTAANKALKAEVARIEAGAR